MRRRVLGVALAVVVLVAGYWFPPRAGPQAVQGERSESPRVSKPGRVTALGRLAPRDEVISVSPSAAQRALRAALLGDVAVYTREEFAAREMAWSNQNGKTEAQIVGYHHVLNYLCALGNVEKMYIPPYLYPEVGVLGNQLLFERKSQTSRKARPSTPRYSDPGQGRRARQ